MNILQASFIILKIWKLLMCKLNRHHRKPGCHIINNLLTKLARAVLGNRPFAAERSRGTNRQTGEQMTHWDMLNKATKFEFSLFNMSPCVICSPVWQFLPRDRSAAKAPYWPSVVAVRTERSEVRTATPSGLAPLRPSCPVSKRLIFRDLATKN